MEIKLAEERLNEVTVCSDCIHFRANTLFTGNCHRLNLNVEIDNKCECWETNNSGVKSEIQHLIEIISGEKIEKQQEVCTHPIEDLIAMSRSFFCRKCMKTAIE